MSHKFYLFSLKKNPIINFAVTVAHLWIWLEINTTVTQGLKKQNKKKNP